MKSQYKRLSHSVWLCKYHIVFCPKYRYKMLEGRAEVFVRNNLYKLCGQKDQVVIEEINIQPDHVHINYAFQAGVIPPPLAVVVDFRLDFQIWRGSTSPDCDTVHQRAFGGLFSCLW